MPDIMVVLACVSQCVELTTLRQLGRVIEAMLSISGRVTMKGLSRWSGPGGQLPNNPTLVHDERALVSTQLAADSSPPVGCHDVVLMSGDHVVVTKSGKTTYGLDRFFRRSTGKRSQVCVF